MPDITVLYAGLFGLFGLFGLMAIALSFPAGRLCGRTGIAIGDGGNRELLLAIRRHANFVEWVPLALIIIALLEMNGAPDIAVHALCGALLLFRIVHALGFKADTAKSPGRVIGASGNALVLVVASIWAIATYF